ncbi:MAG: hypothetical protein CMD88_04600 [Gammaproteobacteria bacterium]|nr:hypothetical protein [Gammaproteobacteria bacterium]
MRKFLFIIMTIIPLFVYSEPIDKGYNAYQKNDYMNAYNFWKDDANKGNAVSQFNLALLYFFGKGVEQNLEKAFFYCSLSANQGLARAQNNLAHMYYKGVGVGQNYVESYKWAYLARKNGYLSQKILNDSSINLTEAMRIEANKRIHEFLLGKNDYEKQ